MSNSKSKKPNAQVDEAVKANHSETEQIVTANQEVEETVVAETGKDESVKDNPEQKADDTLGAKAAESGKGKSKSDNSDEVEAKRIMLQRDVSEVYKVGEYWFTHKPYADNHSKASKQEVKTFKKQ